MNETEKAPAWYYEPWVVLVLLFFVLGPFGLPLLYKSPKFNRLWKTVLTLATIAYTGFLVVGTVDIVREVLKRLAEIQTLLS